MLFLTPEGMRDVDRRTIAGGTPGPVLMDAAGRAVAEETWRAFPHPDWRLVALCGGGNNGGDGFVAARELLGRYREVRAFLAGDPGRLRGDARGAADAYRERGGEVVPLRDPQPLRESLGERALLLDALLGTGTRGPVEGFYRHLLEAAAGFTGPVVAVDAPSGLELETGRLLGPVPRAALTVTFGAAKLGHVLGDGPDVTGKLVVRAIGLDPAALAKAARREDSARMLEPSELESLLPIPPRRAHKRSTGTVAVLAGSRAYSGAAILTCRGALRGGAGLLHALVAVEVKASLTGVHPEVIATPLPLGDDGAFGPAALGPLRDALAFARPDALVMGPGLGGGEGSRAFVRQVLALEDLPPVLLDADGLNAFGGRRGELAEVGRRLRLAITPHPGELGRLLDAPAREIDADRVTFARRAAAELGCAVLLKGAPTVVSAPGQTTVLNLTGNAGLARGGTGDLLSGLAGAFLAKRLAPLQALALAAFVQGLAGDLARAELGTLAMTPSDVADRVPPALLALERRQTLGIARRAGSAYAGMAGQPHASPRRAVAAPTARQPGAAGGLTEAERRP